MTNGIWPGMRRACSSSLQVATSWLVCGLVQAGALEVTVVDSKGAPVADAVVYVTSPAGEPAARDKPYVMDQVDKTYVPHVIAVPRGSQVSFPNSDDIRHHVYSFSPAKKFEIPLYQGVPADPITMEKPGVVALGCNIHDWMSGYILVTETPWYAITDENGKARIDNLPDGELEAEVWHEALKGKPEKTRQKFNTATTKEVRFTIRKKKVFAAFRGAASRGGGYR